MKLVIDTGAYSAFNRGHERLRPYFIADNSLLLPLIVIAELRAGFIMGNQTERNTPLLESFIDTDSVETVDITNITTIHFAQIYKQLRQKGRPIGTNDMWIAAIAPENQAPLLTLDTNFNSIDGLTILKL